MLWRTHQPASQRAWETCQKEYPPEVELNMYLTTVCPCVPKNKIIDSKLQRPSRLDARVSAVLLDQLHRHWAHQLEAFRGASTDSDVNVWNSLSECTITEAQPVTHSEHRCSWEPSRQNAAAKHTCGNLEPPEIVELTQKLELKRTLLEWLKMCQQHHTESQAKRIWSTHVASENTCVILIWVKCKCMYMLYESQKPEAVEVLQR